ncbi:MAG: N-acetyl sugar amidotransferase [Candidatus Methanomethyliaceae archaeon]
MQWCRRCVYNSMIPNISFDSNGVCNYCKIHDEMEKQYPVGIEGERILKKIADDAKKAGRNSKYDCVIGVSGGCDSSFLLYKAKQLGLRVLAVHFDNTWNSKISMDNLNRIVNKLDVDLYIYTVDEDEWDDLALSFLKASVPEIDALSDIALVTTLYTAAEKYNVKYIFDAHSFRTEGFTPLGWFYFDGKYIEDIHKKFGKIKMKTFPNLWITKWMRWMLSGFKRMRPLYYVDYDKKKVMEFLNKEFGWQWYGGHHMENKYTLFCDYYLLPYKFNIDLRYVEFSALIRSGYMSREEALKELEKPPICDDEIINEVKKRLNLSDKDFDEIMNAPKRSFRDYKTYLPTFRKLRPFFWLMYKLDRVPKTFYIKYCKKG